MSKHDDGGPAFPRPRSEGEYSVHDAQEGMTLRDWFAAKAMAAEGPCNKHPTDRHVRAKHAYALADAMLAARGQP